MAALDARKAFDRVNHIKLFHLLCDAGIPVHIIRLLMNCYSKILIVVKWNGSYSSVCSLKSGVRQGGVLSPILFNIYINYRYVRPSTKSFFDLNEIWCIGRGR